MGGSPEDAGDTSLTDDEKLESDESQPSDTILDSETSILDSNMQHMDSGVRHMDSDRPMNREGSMMDSD